MAFWHLVRCSFGALWKSFWGTLAISTKQSNDTLGRTKRRKISNGLSEQLVQPRWKRLCRTLIEKKTKVAAVFRTTLLTTLKPTVSDDFVQLCRHARLSEQLRSNLYTFTHGIGIPPLLASVYLRHDHSRTWLQNSNLPARSPSIRFFRTTLPNLSSGHGAYPAALLRNSHLQLQCYGSCRSSASSDPFLEARQRSSHAGRRPSFQERSRRRT